MTEDILPQLGSAAQRLNKSYDAIGTRVSEIERHLAAECQLGITQTIWHPSRDLALTYARWNKEWRILVGWGGADFTNEPAERKPWSDCDRDTKLATSSLIGPLLALLAEVANEQAKMAEDALASIPDVSDIPF